MRSLLTTITLATSILSANAIQIRQPRAGETPKVVQHEIRRRDVVDPIQHDRNRVRKRQSDVVNVQLTNEETLYFMDVSIGIPPQQLRMHIDTGSSDLWVNVASSQLCEERGDPCEGAGVYNSNSSRTYQYLNSDFNISYVDGTGAYGDYVSDTVSFADVTLRRQQFGIGYQSSSMEGIIGIGYPLNEVAVSMGYQPYANIPQNLVEHGYINTNAYSLWLNDLDANTGSILFGGVNSEKYVGSLETLPILPVQGTYYAEFAIALTAMGANGQVGSISSNMNTAALLDSGSSLMYLPNDITNAIYNSVGATYDRSQGLAFVDCSLANRPDTIDFTFSEPTIRVPMNELVIVAGIDNGSPVCVLGISPAGSNTAVLGDTFLRSAYVVYDIENNEISLAQTNFNSTSDNIQEIQRGSAIPDATSVQGAVTSVAQVSDSARIGTGGFFGSSSSVAAAPTAAVGYNMALIGAAGAMMFAL